MYTAYKVVPQEEAGDGTWERLAEDQMEFAAAKIRWHNVASPDSKAKARAQEDIAIDKARKFAVRALREEGNDEEDVKQAAEVAFKKKVHEAEAAARQQVKQAKAAAQAQLKAENDALKARTQNDETLLGVAPALVCVLLLVLVATCRLR